MLNEKQSYCIYLEDHSAPRYVPMAKPYFGTMEDMIRFKDLLEENEFQKRRAVYSRDQNL